jgi:hypothetical protein
VGVRDRGGEDDEYGRHERREEGREHVGREYMDRESDSRESEDKTLGAPEPEDEGVREGRSPRRYGVGGTRGGQRSASPTRRLNVVFSESAYNTIKDLADQSGKTISDVVRDAIALQKWFIEVRRKGGRILVEERGRVREILNIR